MERLARDKDSPLALVRAAILAASPHNTQPWLFKITDFSIDLYLDSRRYPGALDPYLREEHIGMGCALENLMLAAPANGYAASTTLLPGPLSGAVCQPCKNEHSKNPNPRLDHFSLSMTVDRHPSNARLYSSVLWPNIWPTLPAF